MMSSSPYAAASSRKARGGRAGTVAWGADAAAEEDGEDAATGVSLQTLKLLRQELEDAKLERRTLLQSAQKALKAPIRIDIPHRAPEEIPIKRQTNQRRKVLKEVMDALSHALTHADENDENDARARQSKHGKHAKGQAERDPVWKYDLEIQAVVSLVQDRVQEIVARDRDAHRARAKAHRIKALAKAEESSHQRLRDAERASRQEQASLNEDLYKQKRVVDNLRRKLAARDREAVVRERELESELAAMTDKEADAQRRLKAAAEATRLAEKRALDAAHFMAKQLEDVKNQTEASIATHTAKAADAEGQLASAWGARDDVQAVLVRSMDLSWGQMEVMKSEIEQLESSVETCQVVFNTRQTLLEGIKRDMGDSVRGAVEAARSMVDDMRRACQASLDTHRRVELYWSNAEAYGHWVPQQKHTHLKKTLRDAQEAAAAVREELGATSDRLAAAEASVRSLEIARDERDAKISKLEATEANLMASIVETSDKVGMLNDSLRERDAEVAENKHRLEEAFGELESQTELLMAARDEAEALRTTERAIRSDVWKDASATVTRADARVAQLFAKDPKKLTKEGWEAAIAKLEAEGQPTGAQGNKAHFLRGVVSRVTSPTEPKPRRTEPPHTHTRTQNHPHFTRGLDWRMDASNEAWC